MASSAFTDDKQNVEELVANMPPELRNKTFGANDKTAEQLLRGGQGSPWVMKSEQKALVLEECQRNNIDYNPPNARLLASLLQARSCDVHTGYSPFDRRMAVKLLVWIQNNAGKRGKKVRWSLNKKETEQMVTQALDMIAAAHQAVGQVNASETADNQTVEDDGEEQEAERDDGERESSSSRRASSRGPAPLSRLFKRFTSSFSPQPTAAGGSSPSPSETESDHVRASPAAADDFLSGRNTMSLHEEIEIEEIINALNDALHTGGHRAGEDVDAAFRLAEARLLDLRREVADHEHTRTQLERELREL